MSVQIFRTAPMVISRRLIQLNQLLPTCSASMTRGDLPQERNRIKSHTCSNREDGTVLTFFALTISVIQAILRPHARPPVTNFSLPPQHRIPSSRMRWLLLITLLLITIGGNVK